MYYFFIHRFSDREEIIWAKDFELRKKERKLLELLREKKEA